ncbi:nitric oxide synthase-interacting like protein [Babesia gibsoni]|uniref:Nitric oxide synthase-interacting like protein n=1 Tax=Babesia gibsoni TaxID=33632 RepID=A0AAD8PDV9_BABGI|nr:nitric oxide synthase-interacting like protein [Babesia gibsoni]
MTRHSKNNTANPIFTYHERRKVKDFNTLKQRLGRDSMRKCEQCWLCLSTAIKPVCTPLGYVYCKECILNNLSKQMEDYKQRLQEWEAQCVALERQKHDRDERKSEDRKRKLISESVYGISGVKTPKKENGVSDNTKNRDVSVPDSNFWVSGASAAEKSDDSAAGANLPSKPKSGMKCPITGHHLKLKDLVDMKPDTSDASSDAGSDRIWICSVSQKPISHHQAYLDRKTGKVLLKRYVTVSTSGEETQFISLIPAGTGFSAHNNVSAKKYRPALL